jgi:poly(A) polymerase
VVDPEGEIEVATFRADIGSRDGRHPVAVRFSDAREDALRRDFTVNGLFLDPETGEVIDHVDGLADLERGILRAIGDPAQRFAEDRLRLLRGVRFAATLGFPIEAATWAALVAGAPSVVQVSAERIRDELEKMLRHPRRQLAFHLLSDSGLMAAILPEVEAMRGVEQPPEFHPEGDVHIHTGLVLAHLRDPSFGLALAALLHDIGKPPTFTVTDRIRFHGHDAVGAEMAEAICERLRLSRREREQVVYLVRKHLVFISIEEMRPARRTRLFDEEHFAELLELCRADSLGSHGDLSLPARAGELYRAYLAAGPPVEPLLRGRDLLAIGYDPGPRLGEILRTLEDARRDGEVDGAEEALAWVRARYPLGGGEGGAREGRC